MESLYFSFLFLSCTARGKRKGQDGLTDLLLLLDRLGLVSTFGAATLRELVAEESLILFLCENAEMAHGLVKRAHSLISLVVIARCGCHRLLALLVLTGCSSLQGSERDLPFDLRSRSDRL